MNLMLPLDICEAIVKILDNEEHLKDVRQLSLERDWSLPQLVDHAHPIESFHLHLAAHPHLSSFVRVPEIVCMMNYNGVQLSRYWTKWKRPVDGKDIRGMNMSGKHSFEAQRVVTAIPEKSKALYLGRYGHFRLSILRRFHS
ncbi:hypothetical protein BKA70DRAFT_1238692 [Coprinopsis sp. MPI-PUGE-AT-0042]|nr:hypothetical protein BKA70DRAFT_1238692 [Coprinopsis sp. MPI-PUGE-AT-0042]